MVSGRSAVLQVARRYAPPSAKKVDDGSFRVVSNGLSIGEQIGQPKSKSFIRESFFVSLCRPHS